MKDEEARGCPAHGGTDPSGVEYSTRPDNSYGLMLELIRLRRRFVETGRNFQVELLATDLPMP